MKRQIVKIDEEKCNGCGLCIPNCHEGALQIIDKKARLVSDLMCDGLGACLGHCPEGAITMEEREAQPYDEIAVMKEMTGKGKNTVIAHLQHLKEHNEPEYLKQGIDYLRNNSSEVDFDISEVIAAIHGSEQPTPAPRKSVLMNPHAGHHHGGGCPGSKAMVFNNKETDNVSVTDQPSALTHWPVQMHLMHPLSGHFQQSDFVLAADCTAFTLGNFHNRFLKGKTLGIACPKLDSRKEVYIDKLQMLIDDAQINTLTVVIMEVPCCQGLLQMAQEAAKSAQRKIPVKCVVVNVRGEVVSEEWV